MATRGLDLDNFGAIVALSLPSHGFRIPIANRLRRIRAVKLFINKYTILPFLTKIISEATASTVPALRAGECKDSGTRVGWFSFQDLCKESRGRADYTLTAAARAALARANKGGLFPCFE